QVLRILAVASEPTCRREFALPSPPWASFGIQCRGKEETMNKISVGYVVGSLAKASINRKLALALTKVAPPELQLQEIPIRDLPLYSHDYDSDYPEVARRFKQRIATIDALLFVTPEYNRSI